MSRVVPLTDQTWDQTAGRGTVLAGFWANWCIPSRALQPLLEATARDFDGRLSVGLVDHDANPRLAERFRIQGLPTLILLEGGVEVDRRVGLMARDDLYRLLESRGWG